MLEAADKMTKKKKLCVPYVQKVKQRNERYKKD